MVLGLSAAVIGLWLLLFVRPSIIGFLSLVLGIAVVLGAGPAVLGGSNVPNTEPRGLAMYGLIALVGIGLCLPLAFLTQLGLHARPTAGFAYKYGAKVTVEVSKACAGQLTRRTVDATTVSCANARWTDHGQRVTGALLVDSKDLRPAADGSYGVQRVPAWAYEHNAFTEQAGSGNLTTPLGRLPDWMINLLYPGVLAFIPWVLVVRAKMRGIGP